MDKLYVYCAHSCKVTATTDNNSRNPGTPSNYFCTQDPASNSWIEEQNHPQPKRGIHEWVDRCETEHKWTISIKLFFISSTLTAVYLNNNPIKPIPIYLTNITLYACSIELNWKSEQIVVHKNKLCLWQSFHTLRKFNLGSNLTVTAYTCNKIVYRKKKGSGGLK